MADISIANAAKLLRARGKKVDRAINDAVDDPTEDTTDAATDKEPTMSQADFSYPEKKKAQEKGIVNSASADTSDAADKAETPPKRIRVKR